MAGAEYVLYIKLVSMRFTPIPVAARSKAWVYGRSLAGIVGSNHTGGMDVCECCVLTGRCLCDGLITRPEESYQVCLSVIVKPRQGAGPGPLGVVAPWEKKSI